MDRKIKLATAIALVGLTTAACAPNPYWQYPGANNYNRGTTVARSAPQAGGVAHNHCGKVHTHVLPPQGLAHHHGDGCMAGAAGNPPPVNNQPPANTYAYNPPANNNPYTGSTSAGDYSSYSTPKPATNTGSSYYYDYSGSGSNATGSTAATGSNTGTYYDYGYTGSTGGTTSTTAPASTGGTYAGGDTYVVQQRDTVFQVMRNTGVYWKDIIRLNNLQAPDYTIKPGQTLRLK
ncbi:MAG: LysM peptidoglycan-binding domain-containing protein [Thiothrix sp.]|jgi:LysM repeat protein|uniref:LysM peptidoglycan-binding domain-containing protein n=1 Tax=Thiothrix sp. TaxID=1032 RepID=UPI00260FB6F4|nr:LysM peptidoglycan-binding domain-containing protein [Thiothrix sp.]MDD5395106.1 LysM peptidoglycan-binding domain-containing protein [Thiothrix sp.]